MSQQKRGGAGRAMPHQPVEQTLFRLRVEYAKRGRLIYLGHLEVIHTIERVVHRAGLPYAVTQGFSPRMRTGFSSALPVGTGSRGEYYDLFLTELVPVERALARLAGATAEDLAPLRAGYVPVRAPALTAEITRVGYRVELDPVPGRALDAGRVSEGLARVRALGKIPYARGRKEKVMDLDRTLAGFAVEPAAGGGAAADLDCRCDNEGSLRPEIVLAALDRDLTGSDAPIVSTGVQDLAAIGRYRVERTFQLIELGDGRAIEPMGESARVATSESAQITR